MTITSISSFDLNYKVKEQIDHPHAQIEIYFQSMESSRYDVELLNRTVDLCKLFTDRLYEPLIQIFYKIMLESHGNNWIKSCPVKAVSPFYIRFSLKF